MRNIPTRSVSEPERVQVEAEGARPSGRRSRPRGPAARARGPAAGAATISAPHRLARRRPGRATTSTRSTTPRPAEQVLRREDVGHEDVAARRARDAGELEESRRRGPSARHASGDERSARADREAVPARERDRARGPSPGRTARARPAPARGATSRMSRTAPSPPQSTPRIATTSRAPSATTAVPGHGRREGRRPPRGNASRSSSASGTPAGRRDDEVAPSRDRRGRRRGRTR